MKKNKKENFDKNITVLLPEKEYERLKLISSQLGDIPLSTLCRTLIVRQLNYAEKTNNPISFLEL